MNYKLFLENNKYKILLFLLYSIITFILMIHHEIWKDEAEAWCLVQNLDFVSMIKHIRIEGHPLLWYLLNFPLARLGFSVFSMQFLSFLFMNAAAFIFIFKAPFNNFFKTVFVMSTGFLYWLPVVARNYSLIPLFLFLLAMYYPKRHEKPYIYSLIIILLSNTHILLFGFSAALFLMFFVEQIFNQSATIKNKVCSLLPLCLNFLFLVLFFYNVQHQNAEVIYISNVMSYNSYSLAAILYKTSAFMVYHLFAHCYDFAFKSFPVLIYFLYAFTAFLIGFWAKYNKKSLFYFLSGNLFLFYIFFFVYMTSEQKSFLFVLIIIFCLWITYDKNISGKGYQISKNIINIILSIYFILLVKNTYFLVKTEISQPFSGSKPMSEYIEKNIGNKNIIIIAPSIFYLAPLKAYLPNVKFYTPDSEKDFLSNNWWEKAKDNRNYSYIKLLKKYNTPYIIMYPKYSQPKDKNFKLLFSATNAFKHSEESFLLYKYDKIKE